MSFFEVQFECAAEVLVEALSIRLVERLRQAERGSEVRVRTGSAFGFEGNVGAGDRGGLQPLGDAKRGFFRAHG